ncbi:hypothetical protein LguiB_013310 [Lonicera macranthoides]
MGPGLDSHFPGSLSEFVAGFGYLFSGSHAASGSRGAMPQHFEVDFRATQRDLLQEAAKRFIADHQISSGPGQSSTPFRLPDVPDVLPYLSGGKPMACRVLSVLTPNRFLFLGPPDDELVAVHWGDVRCVYARAFDDYRRSLRMNHGYVSGSSDHGSPADSSEGSVQNNMYSLAAPARRSSSSRRSLLGPAEDACVTTTYTGVCREDTLIRGCVLMTHTFVCRGDTSLGIDLKEPEIYPQRSRVLAFSLWRLNSRLRRSILALTLNYSDMMRCKVGAYSSSVRAEDVATGDSENEITMLRLKNQALQALLREHLKKSISRDEEEDILHIQASTLEDLYKTDFEECEYKACDCASCAQTQGPPPNLYCSSPLVVLSAKNLISDIEVSSNHVLPQLASPKHPTLSWNVVSNANPSVFFFVCDAAFEAASGKAVATCVLFDKALCLSDGVAKKVTTSLALMAEAKTIRKACRNISGLVICSDLRFVISFVSLDLNPP